MTYESPALSQQDHTVAIWQHLSGWLPCQVARPEQLQNRFQSRPLTLLGLWLFRWFGSSEPLLSKLGAKTPLRRRFRTRGRRNPGTLVGRL